MSGTGANLPINIRLTGTAEAEAAFNRVSTTAGTAMSRVSQSTDQASASTGRLGNVLGQAGFQVQDFATQVAMGQNALTAFGVQFAQFAGIFGAGGAIAGAAVTVGLIGAQLLGAGESASQAEARIKTAFDGIKSESEGVRDLIKEIGDLFKSASERAYALSQAQRGILLNNADLRLSNAVQLQDDAATRIPTLEREIAVLERRAQVEAEIARRATRAGQAAPVDQTTDITSALFVARSQLNGLRAEMDLQSRRIGELNAARGAVSRAGSDSGVGEFGPAAPASIEQTRQGLERDYALRQQHAERISSINVALAAGNVSAAEATRLRAESERKLADDLKAMADRQAGATQAVREYAELQRHTSGILVGSASDARAADEIARQIRGTNADPAVRARREAETARTAEREETRRQNEADRFTQNWGDRLATETTRGLFEGTKNGESFFQRIGNSLKNILISAASSALSQNVFQPLIGSVTGGRGASGGGLSLGSLFGGQAQAATPGTSGGGLTDSGSSLGTLRTAYNGLTSPGGLGSYFPGGAAANTGFSSLDGVLNTAIYTPATTGAATGSGFYAGASMAGEAGAFVGGGGAAQSLTLAGSLGPLAAIGGGAYGVYSGIQRGGIGGYTSAAGGAVSAVTGLGMLGAAAGLLPALGVLGPIGLAIGAVLAIAGALMPGAKPSGQGQLARTNLNSGLETTEGLGGKRFSAGNATAAGSTVDNIVTLAKEIGAKLGGASIGGDVAVGVTNGNIYLDINGQKTNAANTEQGAKDIAAAAATMVLNEFRGQGTVGGEYQGIVAGSGSLDALNANLEWYEKTYRVVTEATPKISAFEQSLKALSDQFQPNIEKARELSLSVEAMTAARDRELQKLTVARDRQLSSFEQSLEVRGQRLAGNFEWADTLAFNLQAETFLTDTRKSLEDMGLSAETVADRMSRAEAVLAGERLQIQRQYADQALAVQAQTLAAQQQAEQQALATRQAGAGGALGVVTSLRDYAASLATGEAGGGTALDRLAASQRQFDAIFGAAAAGDANSISGLQGAAEAYRLNAREVFGGGQGFADAISLIGQRIDAIGGLGADALTQSFMIENARANTDRVVDQLAALRADIQMLMMRPVAA